MNTKLHEAIRSGQTEMVRSLIGSGFDVNGKDDLDETSLHYAAECGCGDVVSLLIDSGADINAVNEYGETPLHVAARLGKYDNVSLLLSSGVDVNAKDCHGSTPLHHASRYGHKEAAAVLISHGADINAVDGQGKTSLMSAILNNNWGVVSALGIRDEGRVYEEELRWPIYECAGYLVIGCKIHRIGKWRTFSDVEISDMHEDALSFWKKHGSAILAWADRKA